MPLLKSLLSVDPAQRPSAAGLLAHIAKMAEAGLMLASLAGLAKIAGSGSLSNGGSGSGSGTFGSGMLQRAKEAAASKVHNMAKAAKKRLQSNDTNNHGGIAGDLDITYVCPKLIAMAGPGEVSCLYHSSFTCPRPSRRHYPSAMPNATLLGALFFFYTAEMAMILLLFVHFFRASPQGTMSPRSPHLSQKHIRARRASLTWLRGQTTTRTSSGTASISSARWPGHTHRRQS